MANISKSISIEFTGTLELTEVEMRALDAIVGYGSAAFLKVFKDNLGTGYIRDHEAGVHSLFKAVARDIGPALRDVSTIRKDIVAAAKKRCEEKATIPNPQGEPK